MTTATITMPLKPWGAPNFALIELPPGKREDGVKELPSIPVADLSEEALNELAAGWIADLYRKAKKPNRWTRHTSPEQHATLSGRNDR